MNRFSGDVFVARSCLRASKVKFPPCPELSIVPAGEHLREFDNVSLRIAALDAECVQLHNFSRVVFIQPARRLPQTGPDGERNSGTQVRGVYAGPSFKAVPIPAGILAGSTVSGRLYPRWSAGESGSAAELNWTSARRHGERDCLDVALCLTATRAVLARPKTSWRALPLFSRVYALETVSLRAMPQYLGVLAKFITQMLGDEICTIFGDGERSRNFSAPPGCSGGRRS